MTSQADTLHALVQSRLIGASEVMDRIRDLVVHAAVHSRNVVVSGEPGTGRRLVTTLVHDVARLAGARRPQLVFSTGSLETSETAVDSLFSGLAILPIALPPLRERRADIPQLISYFNRQYALRHDVECTALTIDALSLLGREWSGNIRELREWVEESLDGSARPAATAPTKDAFSISFDRGSSLDQLEQRYIQHVLVLTRGNQSEAADWLGIDRRTLYRKLKSYRTVTH